MQFFTGTPPASALQLDYRADVVAPIPAPPARQTQAFHRTRNNDEVPEGAPPPPPMWARPSSTGTRQETPPSHRMSYPPPSSGSSHAADAAAFFSSQAASSWTSPWFLSESPLPPPLHGRSDMTWSSSWQQYGNAKTLIGTALFCDLSVVWWKVQWDVQEEQTHSFAQSRRVRREAKFLDQPDALPAEQLWDACSTYGEQVAQFAEAAERGGVPIARGESRGLLSSDARCTDMVNRRMLGPGFRRIGKYTRSTWTGSSDRSHSWPPPLLRFRIWQRLPTAAKWHMARW